MSLDFDTLQKKAITLAQHFPHQWDTKTHFVDLVEEVGELANAILILNRDKDNKRKRSDLEDSLADILFQLIQLAHSQNIDLLKVLDKQLEDLEVRLKNREYHDDD